eukprot:m.61894 g.61894  ORF g.61894 m.61894 type:complete len:922 (+) comp11402_c0_seq9:171-2936(+)
MPPGHRRRRRMPKTEEKSFADHMKTASEEKEKAQARVLNSVRTSVHSVETARPFTPMDSSRGLFGMSRGFQSRTSSATSTTSRRVPRPPSAFNIGRRQFLENLPDTTYLERPRTGVHTQSSIPTTSSSAIVNKTTPALKEYRRRTASTSSTRIASSRRRQNADIESFQEDATHHQPVLKNNDGEVIVSPETDEPKAKQLRTNSSDNGVDGQTNSDKGRTPAPPPPTTQKSRRMPKPPTSANKKTSRLSSRSGVSDSGDGRRVASADRRRIASADVQEHTRWERLGPLLSKLSIDSQTDVLLDVVLKIEQELRESGSFKAGSHNSELLRSLVRLTDMTDCRLLARLSRVILMITRSGTVKSVCKLLFKQSRTAANDPILVEENIPDLLVAVMESCKVPEHTEALVYCCGAMKNLSSSNEVQEFLVSRNLLPIMKSHIDDVLASLDRSASPTETSPTPTSSKTAHAHKVHFVVQLTAVLRNLAVKKKHISAFLNCGAVESLCSLVLNFTGEKDIIFNTVRILSKVTVAERGKDAVSSCSGVITSMAKSFSRHGGRKALCVRLLYVLGNLTIDSDDNRNELFIATQNGENLLEVLKWRGRELVDVLTRQGEEDVDEMCGDNDTDVANNRDPPRRVRKTSAKAKESSDSEIEDLVVKLVRVLANLCITESLGVSIASDDGLSLLLDILRCPVVKDGHDDLLMNVVGCVNNISFYRFDDNYVQKNMLHFATVLAPLLLSSNMALFVEVARVFGNFSQEQGVRDLLVENRSDEVLCLLLAHDDKDVVYSVCGILINLLSDPQHRHILTKDEYVGLENLIDVMAVCGEEEGDWQTAGLACKALWNYADELAAQHESNLPLMAEDHMSDLIDILSDLTDDVMRPDDDFTAEVYMSEFYPVAVHLLQHIQSRANPLEPLQEEEDDDNEDI